MLRKQNNVAEQEVNPSNSRELIRQWVQTEHIISEEKTAWQVEKQQMQELLEIYQQELKLLNEELNVAGSSADLIDENKEKLESGLAQYREAKQILRSSMASIVPRMQKLVGRFPAPLVEELGSDIDLISSPEALDKPRDVLKSVIAILNAAGSFNRTLTLSRRNTHPCQWKKDHRQRALPWPLPCLLCRRCWPSGGHGCASCRQACHRCSRRLVMDRRWRHRRSSAQDDRCA